MTIKTLYSVTVTFTDILLMSITCNDVLNEKKSFSLNYFIAICFDS